MSVEQSRLLTVAEDIEYFSQWWKSESVDTTAIRHGSGILRRLLVEDAAGTGWRALGFKKEPTIQGPDLLAFFRKEKFDVGLTAGAISAGVRHEGIDTAFLSARSVDNPTTGVLASADVGFAVCVGSAMRDARNPAPSADLDPLIERTWYLHEIPRCSRDDSPGNDSQPSRGNQACCERNGRCSRLKKQFATS